MNPTKLKNNILTIIQKAISSNEIDLNTLRIIAIGPDRSYSTLNVYIKHNWDKYPYFSDDESIARVSLSEWLNELDTLSLEHKDATYESAYKEKKAELREMVIKTLRLLAVEQLLVTPNARIALMEIDFLGEDSSFVTAFAHPRGNGELLPLMEKRPPTNLYYPYGVLHEDGLTTFYPEGIDVEGTSFEHEEPGVQEFLFDDLETATPGDGEEISLVRKNDAYDYSFEGGHTKGEYGFPDDDEVERRLFDHFSGLDCFFDPLECPDPSDSDAFNQWMDKYCRSKKEFGSSVVERGSKKYGAKAMQAFVDGLPTTASDRMRTIASHANCLADEGLFEDALNVAAKVHGNDKCWLYDTVPMALLRLGRYKDAVDTAREQLSSAEGQFRENNARGTLALALSYTNDTTQAEKEARQLIEDDDSHRKGYYCLARSLYHTDLPAAIEALNKALISDRFEYDEAKIDFQGMPELIDVMNQRKALDDYRTTCGQQIKDKLTTVTIPHYPFEENLKPPYLDYTKYEFDDEIESPYQIQHLDGQRYVSLVWNKGLHILELQEKKTFKHLYTITDASMKHFAVKDHFVYASHSNEGFFIYDCSGEPKLLTQSDKLFNHFVEGIRVDGNIAGIGDDYGINLYDISQPDQPSLLSTIGTGRDRSDINALAHDFLIKDNYVYIANNDVGLVVFDISNPAQPNIVSVLQGIKLNNNAFCAKKIALFANTAFLYDYDILWVIDVSNPTSPVSLGTFKVKSESPWIDSEGRFLVPAKGGTFLVFEEKEKRAEYAHTILFKKEPPGYERTLPTNNGFIGIEDDEYFIAKPTDAVQPAWEEYKKIPPLKDKLLSWVQEGLQHFIDASASYERPEDETQPSMFPVGVLILETLYGRLTLTIDGQRSRSELHKGPICNSPLDVETTLDELFGEGVCPEQLDDYDSDLSPALVKERNDLLRNTWKDLFNEVFTEIKQQKLLDQFESGRIFLGMRAFEDDASIVDTYINDNYPWNPYRYTSREFQLSDVKELLDNYSGYKHIDRLVNMAENREDIKNEIYRLAIKGVRYALICTRDLEDTDPEGVKTTFLAAAEEGVTDLTLIRYFRHNMGIPQAKDILNAIYPLCTSEQYEEKLVCAVALNKLETDEMVDYIKELLAEDHASKHEWACLALEQMDTRINEFQDALIKATQNSNTWGLHLLAKQLMRTGYPKIPEALIKKAKEEKRYENMGSMGLDFDDNDDDDSAKDVEREWSANLFIEHLKSYQDPATPLWPASLPPEANHQGWRYWMDKAGPKICDNELMGKMVDILTSHVTANNTWKHDHAMFRGVISWLLEVKQLFSPGATLASAMVNAEEGIFDDKDIKFAKRALEYELGNRAWEHVKSKEYDQAREIADTLLEHDPNNGEFLFLDARLVWLMESIDACLEKIDESLQLPGVAHSPVPRHGRARLLNLKGCALDEAQRFGEALEVFKETVSEDPENAMYHANLAEINDKLGNEEEALRWANSAQKLGSESNVIVEIISRLSS